MIPCKRSSAAGRLKTREEQEETQKLSLKDCSVDDLKTNITADDEVRVLRTDQYAPSFKPRRWFFLCLLTVQKRRPDFGRLHEPLRILSVGKFTQDLPSLFKLFSPQRVPVSRSTK